MGATAVNYALADHVRLTAAIVTGPAYGHSISTVALVSEL